MSVCIEEIDVTGSGSSRDASTDSDADDDDAVMSADKAFTVSLQLSQQPL